jgi:TPR repeat protein
MEDSFRLRICGSSLAIYILAAAFNLVFVTTLAPAAECTILPLEAKAEKGFVPSEIELARAYFAGCGVTQNLERAAYWYQKAAEGGDPGAQNLIGFLYQTGTGVPADSKRAMHWYQLSASSGLLPAKVNVGVLYLWGIGARRDPALAAQLFRDAARKRSGTAAAYLGIMYYFGRGVNQDRTAAEHWFATGVKLRDPIAAFALASLYLGKDDHPRNLAKAAALLRASARGGYVSAMHLLGLLLINHPELARDPQEAHLSLEGASELGSWESSTLLGLLARDGKGEGANPDVAYYDFQLAILQGGDAARRLLINDLNILSEKLTSEQMIAITSKANAWFQKHPLALALLSNHDETLSVISTLDLMTVDDNLHADRVVHHPSDGAAFDLIAGPESCDN